MMGLWTAGLGVFVLLVVVLLSSRLRMSFGVGLGSARRGG
jgi:hypothetical protein